MDNNSQSEEKEPKSWIGKKWKSGISLRKLHVWLIVSMILLSGIVLYSTYRMTITFIRLADEVEVHMEMENAAHELMDASDYLTENVQRFTINGDLRFLDNYFTEAFESKRREDAIDKMDTDPAMKDALQDLNEAMEYSVELMGQEYYAMRLVIEAKGYTDYPKELNDISLSAKDKALSDQEKMERATEIVLNDEYYEQKDHIRQNMQESIEKIDKLVRSTKKAELDSLRKDLGLVHCAVLIQILSILFIICLTSHLGIHPIIRAVDRIREDSHIPETGSREFRYLAQAYNKMYTRYRTSLENLNFKVSHDKLTGAYNRAGYDLLLANIDFDTTYMMLFDVDNFKSVNDHYGHEVGDRILIKLVQVLKGIFRDDDCICRIGGDEFVVFMVHSGNAKRKLIESKLNQISQELENTEDGLPPVSISVGIVRGKDVEDPARMFEKTDAAMYEAKKQGKNTYIFYTKE